MLKMKKLLESVVSKVLISEVKEHTLQRVLCIAKQKFV